MNEKYQRLPENVRRKIYENMKNIYKQIFTNPTKYIYFQTEKRDAPVFTIMKNNNSKIFIRHTYDGKYLEKPNTIYRFTIKYIDEDNYIDSNIILNKHTIILFTTKKYFHCAWSIFKNASFCYMHWLHKANYDVSKVEIPEEEDKLWFSMA